MEGISLEGVKRKYDKREIKRANEEERESKRLLKAADFQHLSLALETHDGSCVQETLLEQRAESHYHLSPGTAERQPEQTAACLSAGGLTDTGRFDGGRCGCGRGRQARATCC